MTVLLNPQSARQHEPSPQHDRKGTRSRVPQSPTSPLSFWPERNRRPESPRWLLLLLLIVLTTCAQSLCAQTIRIQFLNGKNGKPLRNTPVVINRNALPPEKIHLGTLVLRTDSNGIVNVQATSNELISANPERSFGRSCYTNDRYGPLYESVRILQEGIVEENHCGRITFPAAQPGLLVVAFRRETFIEGLGDD